MRTQQLSFFVAVSFMLGLTTTTFAQSNSDEGSIANDDSGWHWKVTPYVWVPAIDGDVGGFGAAPVDLDLTVGDFAEKLVDDLDFAIVGAVEARRDNYGVFVDVLHLDLTTEDASPSPAFSGVEVGQSMTMATALAYYRFHETPNLALDAMGGARLWDVDVDLDLKAGFAPAMSISDGDTWVDPMVGIRGTYDIDENWGLIGWGLIGAGASDIGWDLSAVASYEFNQRFSLLAGYRAVAVDYEKDGFVFDTKMVGPILGAEFKF